MNEPIQVGDIVYYYGKHSDNVCRGYVAETAISQLSGNKRLRVVDFKSEMSDPEAGIWRDVFSQVISAFADESAVEV